MATDTNLIAEWLFSEGTGTSVQDSIGNADLTLNFAGDGAWVTNAAGDGVSFTDVLHAGGVSAAAPLTTSASSITDALGDACQKFTFVAVISEVTGASNKHRIVQIGAASSNGDFGVTSVENGTLNEIRVAHDTGTALTRGYSEPINGTTPLLLAVIVDLTEAAAADRLTVFVNGVAASDYAADPGTTNDTIDFTASATSLTLMNRGSGNRGVIGKMWAAALFDNVVPLTQLDDIEAVWLSDNNASLSSTAPVTVTPETGSFGLNATEPAVTHGPAAGTVTPDAVTTLSLNATQPVVSHTDNITLTASDASFGMTADTVVMLRYEIDDVTFGMTTESAVVTNVAATGTIVTAETGTFALNSTQPAVSHVPAAVTVTAQTATFTMASTEPGVFGEDIVPVQTQQYPDRTSYNGSPVNLDLGDPYWSSNAGAMTYRAVGLPGGLTMDTSTGIVTGTPNTNSIAQVDIYAANSEGETGPGEFQWSVIATPVVVPPEGAGLSLSLSLWV